MDAMDAMDEIAMTRRSAAETEPLPQLPPRRDDSHKGDYGRAVLIGGSLGMAGAISLAGMATLRAGAGLVTLAVPDRCQATVAGYEPCYMTVGFEADDAGRIAAAAEETIGSLVAAATAVGLGPGLGRSPGLERLVGSLYATVTQSMVVDADALYALSEQRELLATPGGPRILTPHAGEFSRLTGQAVTTTADRTAAAADLASRCGVIVVLKGNQTVVSDGNKTFLGTNGNPGMATGGSGDVLTGVITALLCQGQPPLAAARLGVHVHGLAGDLAAAQMGQVGMIARDLIDFLPKAFG
jgi:ADP-dependent NAD(P)H-hydrate dehydratase